MPHIPPYCFLGRKGAQEKGLRGLGMGEGVKAFLHGLLFLPLLLVAEFDSSQDCTCDQAGPISYSIPENIIVGQRKIKGHIYHPRRTPGSCCC